MLTLTILLIVRSLLKKRNPALFASVNAFISGKVRFLLRFFGTKRATL